MTLFEMKQQRAHALDKAESILRAAENASRAMTATESSDYDNAMLVVHTLNPQVEAIEKTNTLSKHIKNGRLMPGGGAGQHDSKPATRILSPEYPQAFLDAFLGKPSAASYEGSDGAGGFAVPSMVDGQIVPLAASESAVMKLATVLTTTMDIRIPVKSGHGAVALKSESGGSTNLFTESDPTLTQVPLSAWMVGGVHTASWELVQDVSSFAAFVQDDLSLAQGVYLESLFVGGTGNGQPQGLLGNVGTGITAAAADSAGNLLSIAATFDVLGKLNAVYHPGASWLMRRDSSIELRRAQMASNLFAQVFTRVGTQDYLHGYPVEYSTAMPAIAASATPVLFGDFKRGYIIGVRGGGGINIKILDQPLATAGQIQFLGYQRVDGRVRRSEAIQAITLHS